MGDEQYRGSGRLASVEEQFLHRQAGLRVEGAEGLVHQEQARLGDPGARDGDALAHAAGELVGSVVLEPGQAHERDETRRARSVDRGGHVGEAERERDVAHREPGDEQRFLEHDAPVEGKGTHLTRVPSAASKALSCLPITQARGAVR